MCTINITFAFIVSVVTFVAHTKIVRFTTNYSYCMVHLITITMVSFVRIYFIMQSLFSLL